MAENELSKLKKRRGMAKASLTRFRNFLDSYVPDRDYNVLKVRFEKAKALLAEFENIHFEIEIAEDSNDDNARQLFEDTYYEQIARAQELIEERERVEVSAASISSATENANLRQALTQLSNLTTNEISVKLPTITLPKFEGKYEEWLSFEDSFRALVHNNTKIQTVQKLNYLKSCLIGNAAQVIQSLTSTAENYEIAWNLLKDRYSNKRIIIQNHVKALFELQAIAKESALNLSTLIDTALRHIHTLQVLDQPVEGWDALLLHLIGSKVDKTTRLEWEKSLDGIEMPTWDQYLKFLRNRCHVLEAIPSEVSSRENAATNRTFNQSKVTSSKPRQVLLETQIPKLKCHVCGENHYVQGCDRFKAMSQNERSESIKRAGLCFNCFRANHKSSECRAGNCKKCDRKHHTMLHLVRSSSTTLPAQEGVESESKAAAQSLSSRLKNTSQILLSTAVVDILDASGQSQKCRVLLDAGSQSNFMTEQFCDRLRLPTRPVNIPISGIGETLSYIKYVTSATIKSRSEGFRLKLECLVIPRVTEILPSKSINSENLDIPKSVILADPTFDQPNQVDMLIGAEHFYYLLKAGQIKTKIGTTILQSTRFGWIVSGRIDSPGPILSNLCHLARDPLEDAVQRFWEIEELPTKKILSSEEEASEKHYQQTIKRLPSGRYVVGLPFNDQKEKLGESYETALRRFQGLERKLSTNPKLSEDYRNFIKEYEALGHMTRIKDSSLQEGCFLPHHAVVKDSSTTTKVRVVFDASAKTTFGLSLNDTLLTGPVVQQELFSIVTRFRLHTIVFTADIEKMYRQVLIRKEDRRYQQILWRDNPEESIRIYELNTVTYGTSSAPYQATRTLKQLAADEKHRYPEAAELITRDMSVDDLLSGAETMEQAQGLRSQVSSLLSSGGFHLRKWASNHPQFNDSQKIEDKAEEYVWLDSSEIHKILGILWNPRQDCLLYRITTQKTETTVTKRSILSQVASMYDPLGLLGPVIVKLKILLQTLWKLQLDWDEVVPSEICTSWRAFQESKGELNDVSFPRQVCIAQHTDLQLHGFADASEAAYGACLYMRSSNACQSNHVVLVSSKTRVAPFKTLSLPRLELCAALLLAHLCQTALKAFDTTFSKIILWSDSTIALQWIRTQPHRLKTFVANRVASIQDINAHFEWRHISSHDNPADLVSRGLSPSEFVGNTLWIRGPAWLAGTEDDWPNFPLTLIEIPEQRTTISLKTERSFSILRQFSSITTLQRVMAWCLRFIRVCRTKIRTKGSLSTFELNRAMITIVKLVQVESFANEIRRLEVGKSLKEGSKLIPLHPFLDFEGVMRVGGRLAHAALNCDKKHQILLPENHYVTDLIIREAHNSQLHAGTQATLYHVGQKYWPIHGKNCVKKVIHRCIICFKARPKMMDYVEGNLPKDRFENTRPFLNAGVDYCGPFWIKEKKHRNRSKVKVYVSIFVCLSSKAVHLELVSDLTTEAFIAALKRFFSRRGKSNIMMSDNATNFVGARNELRELHELINTQPHTEALTRWLTDQEISWKFIPPRSPHFGGIWEAAVRSFKHHLYRVAKDTLFTYEQFNTLIIEIEAVLNSRPLTPLSSDPDDLNVLTPSHLLIGGLISSIPEVNFTDTATNRLSKWQHLQKLKRDFWNRWNKEYLTELTQRAKGKGKTTRELRLGELVMLREDNTPPLYWPLGRVAKLYPGTDGVTRVIDVKTANGTYKRAVKNVALLPISPADN